VHGTMPQMIMRARETERRGCINLVGSSWCRPIAATAEKEEPKGPGVLQESPAPPRRSQGNRREQHAVERHNSCIVALPEAKVGLALEALRFKMRCLASSSPHDTNRYLVHYS
jgi:hypothetical protein